ncbi:hypothetical protein LSAT2_021855 [Lamellibrachia satsuma]|nr:hypothetical protein LSAT2_021855 [Lamellibrachia satsuma]
MSGSGKFLRGLVDRVARSLKRAVEQPLELELDVVGSQPGKRGVTAKQTTPKQHGDNRGNESGRHRANVASSDALQDRHEAV